MNEASESAPTIDLGSSRFDTLRVLGTGAFGTVYEARDRELGVNVAVKVVHDDDAGSLALFKQEFRLLADLVHPHVVVLHELFTQGPRWYFTMELVEGCDLSDWLGAGGPRTEAVDDRLIRTFAGIVDGLRALHGASLVHLDLKPANVRVTPEGRPVLLDFGLARCLRRTSARQAGGGHAVGGTPRYMAPEQWWMRAVSPATDTYALGTMLYEALCGEHPMGTSAGRLIVPNARYRVPAEQRTTPARDRLASLAEAMLAYEPEDRPALSEVHEILAELASVATESPRALVRRDEPRSAAAVDALASADLVDREAELEALLSAYSAAERGGISLARVSGPAGFGKSALLEALRSKLERDRGAIVLTGRSTEREAVPFKGLDGAVDALCELLLAPSDAPERAEAKNAAVGLARLFPVFHTLGGPAPYGVLEEPERLRAHAASTLGRVLAALAATAPVALLLDDLHWADADTAHLLGELCLAEVPHRLFLVLAHRSGAAHGDFLPAFTRLTEPMRWAAAPLSVTVGPLSRSAAAALAARHLPNPAPRAAIDHIVNSAGGSPLLIGELAYEIRERPGALVGQTLDAVVASRVGDLPPEASALLATLAVAGAPVDGRTLLTAAGPSAEGLTALALLRARGLVRSTPQRGPTAAAAFELTHGLVGEFVAARLDATQARARHRALADAMLAGPNAPRMASLAYHLQQAGDTELACVFAHTSAERARAALAFDLAADQYQAVLRYAASVPWPTSLPPRGAVEDVLLEVLVASGRSADAAPLFEARAQRATGAARLELRRQAIEHWLVAGRLAEGVARVGPLVAAQGVRRPATGLGRGVGLAGRLVHLKLAGGPELPLRAPRASERDTLRIDACWAVGKALTDILPVEALGFQVRSLLMAARSGDATRCARAMAAFGGLWLWQGTPRAAETGERYIRRAGALCAEGSGVEVSALIHVVSGAAAMVRGRWQEALAEVELGQRLLDAGERHLVWEGNMAMLVKALVLEATGRARELRSLGLDWHRAAAARGDVFAQVTSTVAGANAVLANGDPEGMREGLAAALRRWPLEATVQEISTVPSLVLADLYEGAPLRAWERLERSWKAARAAQLFRAAIIRIKYRWARASVALALAAKSSPGAVDRMLAVARADARALRREVRSDGVLLAGVIEAVAIALDGDLREAWRRLEDVEGRLAAAGMEVHASCIGLARGQSAGGTSGAALATEARRKLILHGVRDPWRWTGLILPGMPRSG